MEKNELDRIMRAVLIARRRLLDLSEMELDGTQHWIFIRKKILECFGSNGLEGMIKSALENNNQKDKISDIPDQMELRP